MNGDLEIPAWYQYSLLNREVGNENYNFFMNLDDSSKLYPIEAVVHDQGIIFRLGEFFSKCSITDFDLATRTYKRKISFEHRSLFFVNRFIPSRRNDIGLTKVYDGMKSWMNSLMIKKFDEIAKPIKMFQGSLEEVTAEVGEVLEIVPSKEPETFVRVKEGFSERSSDYWLRVKTALLGGQYVAHYQPGSSIGTPVRIKGKI